MADEFTEAARAIADRPVRLCIRRGRKWRTVASFTSGSAAFTYLLWEFPRALLKGRFRYRLIEPQADGE